MITPPATVADFKAQFNREFDYGARKDQVMDSDLTRALNEASLVFNPTLWVDDDEKIIAYCYSAAHFLVLNLQTAGGLSLENTSQGVNSKGRGPIISRNVGNVATTYQYPDWILNSPILSGFLTTMFGNKYLQLLTPRCVGAGYVVAGFNELGGLGEHTLPEQQLMYTGNFDVDPTVAPIEYMFTMIGPSEVSARILIARSGTIKALIVKCGANTLDGEAIFTLMKNGSAQTLTTTLDVGVNFNQDVFHSVAVSGTDEISIKVDVSAASAGLLSSLRATVIFQP